MAGTLYAGFDLARVGSMSVVVTDDFVTGETDALPTERYCHIDLQSVMGSGKYDDLASALQAIMPFGNYLVSYSSSTRLYTIFTSDSVNVTLDFTSASGARLAAALGFTAANPKATGGSGYACTLHGTDSGSGITFTSDVLPYYLVPLARTNPAHWSRPYEEQGFVKRAVSVNANVYAVNPITINQLVDFDLAYMPLANVFVTEAVAAQPWTIEHLCKHARAHQPVMAEWTAGSYVMRLSEADAAFRKELRSPAFTQAPEFHGLWSCSFSGAQYLGKL